MNGHRRTCRPGVALAVAAALLATPVGRAQAGGWRDGFEGAGLDAAWRSAGAGPVKVAQGRAVLPCGEEGSWIERRVGLDGNDAVPLRAGVSLSAGGGASRATVSLRWSDREHVSVELAAAATGGAQGVVRWATAGEAEQSRPSAFRMNGPGVPGWLRFVVASRTVDVSASRDGVRFRHLLTLGRGEGRFAGPPAAMRIGDRAVSLA